MTSEISPTASTPLPPPSSVTSDQDPAASSTTTPLAVTAPSPILPSTPEISPTPSTSSPPSSSVQSPLVQCQSPWIAFQGSCYARFTQTSSWVGADTHCKSESAQLVKIESADENEFIRQNFLPSGGDYWIGLTDAQTEGVWKWSDGSPLTGYTHWDSNEPTGVNWENCGGIRNTGAHWFDRSCTDWKGCICKK
ncbi:hypothetical protein ACROYT_G022945 [Oculina patagonica]